VRALGIDVGAGRKGLDLVLMDDSLVPAETHRRVPAAEVGALIAATGADVVAIDCPPGWGFGSGTRRTERELRTFGIQSFGTPTEDRGQGAFYDWIREGIKAFGAAAEAGYPRYGSGPVRNTAIEVFPHASAVVLAGCLPPANGSKRAFREGVLRAQGVRVNGLRSADQVDAALAALTGLLALNGRRTYLGDPAEGVIVLPVASLPARPYGRCRQDRRSQDVQLHFPGLARCACGDPECRASTSGEFARGHDAKRKSALWTLARSGHEAVDELRSRKWELPPEMR